MGCHLFCPLLKERPGAYVVIQFHVLCTVIAIVCTVIAIDGCTALPVRESFIYYHIIEVHLIFLLHSLTG